jgi:hypothetical protein
VLDGDEDDGLLVITTVRRGKPVGVLKTLPEEDEADP